MIGVGLDAVEIDRFRAVLSRRPGFVERFFTEQERADLADRADAVPGFAARFAAKEATMKCLGVGLGAVAFSEIEVIRSASGAPELRLYGSAEELARRVGAVAFHVSLTHTARLASAIVLAE